MSFDKTEQVQFDAEVQRRLETKQGKVSYADPSPMNGIKQAAKYKDGSEIGKALYERIKHKLKR